MRRGSFQRVESIQLPPPPPGGQSEGHMRVTGVALSKSPPLFLLSPLQLSVVCGRQGGSLPCMWKKSFFLFHQDLFPQRQQSLSVKPRSTSLQHSEAQDILLWLSAGGLNSRSCFQMPWSPAVLNAGSKLKLFLPFFFLSSNL